MKIVGRTTLIEPEEGNIFVRINENGEYQNPKRILVVRDDATVESLGYSEVLMSDFVEYEEKRNASLRAAILKKSDAEESSVEKTFENE